MQRENAEYICPMHPEVRQKGPGKCPKCGMFLEPVGTISGHAHKHMLATSPTTNITTQRPHQPLR